MMNEVLRERIRRLPKTETWTCRMFLLAEGSPASKRNPEETVFRMLAVQDEAKHVLMTLSTGLGPDSEELEAQLFEELLALGRAPKRLVADSPETAALLEELCRAAGITLAEEPNPAESASCEVVQLLNAPQETVVIHDAFCEILLQLRDEELLRMPRDLAETLVHMEVCGAVPAALAGRLCRLFGIA